MILLVWNPAYALGIATIDAQHEKMISILNRLYHAMRVQNNTIEVNDLLAEFLRETTKHIITEETLMSQHRYPHIKEHKKGHDEYLDKAKAFQDILKRGGPIEQKALYNFLSRWIDHHMNDDDHKMGEYLRSKGVK